MKLQLIETALTASKVLSIGAWYVKKGLERQGHTVDVCDSPQKGYDAELISVHHVTDFKTVVNMPKRSPYRVIGGHALYTNYKPLIPFADFLCFGEWDEGFINIEELHSHPSVNTSKFQHMYPLPVLQPYLNHSGTNSAAWYIEIARGCPYACKYCQLGNTIPYRKRTFKEICQAIDLCDFSLTRKVNLFAPDEASHSDYDDILLYIQKKGGFPSGFGSMRVEKARKLKGIRANTLIRCGIDGLTEQRRFSVNKRIADHDILSYFKTMIHIGHVNFKMFMIFGYEGETLTDFDCWARVMNHVLNLPLKKNAALRIKWTPFIPQPGTPLKNDHPQYDLGMVKKIQKWHLFHRQPMRNPGWHVENDGIMSQQNHKKQCELTTASEDYFL